MRFGTLDFTPALDSPDLLAAPTAAALRSTVGAAASDEPLVAAIDPTLAAPLMAMLPRVRSRRVAPRRGP